MTRPSAAACPDHIGEKSPEPAASALARSGASAPAANGNSGATGLIGPISRITRLTMPRAGRPVIRLVTAVPSSPALLQRGTVRRRDFRFRAMQIGAADLHARRAEHEGRSDPAGIADGAGGDHRHLHRVGDLRNEREAAGLPGQIVAQEDAAMTAGLKALRDHRIDAVLLQPARLLDRRGRAQHEQPAAFTRRSSDASGKPK